MYIHVCAVKSNLPVSERKWAELAEATANDQELQQVIRGIEDGGDVCPKPYRTFIEELSIVDGVMLLTSLQQSCHMLTIECKTSSVIQNTGYFIPGLGEQSLTQMSR